MSENKKTDLLMNFRHMNNQYVNGECRARVNPDDGLAGDFRDGQFLEIDEFNFGVGLSDGPIAQTRGPDLKAMQRQGVDVRALQRSGALPPHGSGGGADFSRWRYGSLGRGERFPVDVQEVSITRQLDDASPQFFQACSKKQMFRSAALVKRTIAGDNYGMKTFMRLDFKGVLIVGVEWEDDEVVKETIKFMCRGVEAVYAKTDATGARRENSGTWDPFDTTR